MGLPSGLEKNRVIRVQCHADAAYPGSVGKIRRHADRERNVRRQVVSFVAGGEVTEIPEMADISAIRFSFSNSVAGTKNSGVPKLPEMTLPKP